MKYFLKHTHIAIKVIFMRYSQNQNALLWLLLWNKQEQEKCYSLVSQESCRTSRHERADCGARSPSPLDSQEAL